MSESVLLVNGAPTYFASQIRWKKNNSLGIPIGPAYACPAYQSPA